MKVIQKLLQKVMEIAKSIGHTNILVESQCTYSITRTQNPDTPQFRGGNPYFFIENLYKSVSFIYASMYHENVHAIHIAMQFAKKLCKKNRQPAAKNQNWSFTSRGAT